MSNTQRDRLWQLFEFGRDRSTDLRGANTLIEAIIANQDIPDKINFPANRIRAEGFQIEFVRVIRSALNLGLAEAKQLSDNGILSGVECHPDIVKWLKERNYI